MHELAIARNIQEIVEDQLRTLKEPIRVAKLNLKIGRMTTIVPEILEFYLKLISEGTVLEAASLAIDEVPICAYCKGCGSSFEIQELQFVCPNCQSSQLELTSGRELVVESIEVEESKNL